MNTTRQTLDLLIATALGMAFLLVLLPAGGHDQLWFLLMAQRLLHGATLYGPTAFDSNTPAIVWLSTLPVWLAQTLHLPLQFIAKLLVLILVTTVAILSGPLLRRILPILTRNQGFFLTFLYLLLTCVIPARDFGQRDHLTAILLIPYLLAAACFLLQAQINTGVPHDHQAKRGYRGVRQVAKDRPTSNITSPPFSSEPSWLLRTAFALLAAIGICLKPQQALVPLAIELTILFAVISSSRKNKRIKMEASSWRSQNPRISHPSPRHSRLQATLTRPEPLTLLLTGALFLLAIHRFTPLYFTLALPTTLATYWAIGNLTPWHLFLESIQLHILALISFFLYARRSGTRNPLISIFLVAGTASTLAYYLQGTGWYYQQLPAITFFGLALSLQLLALLESRTIPQLRWLPIATAALGLLTLGLIFHFSGYPFTTAAFDEDHAYQISQPDPTFFANLAPGTSVAILTTSVDDAIMPIFRYRLTWAQRTNNLWTLPAILRSDTPGKHQLPPQRLAQLSAQQHLWMVEDLNHWHPTLILIARCQSPEVHCQTLEDRHDNLLNFFLTDPAFATIFRHYHFLRTAGPYDAYTLQTP